MGILADPLSSLRWAAPRAWGFAEVAQVFRVPPVLDDVRACQGTAPRPLRQQSERMVYTHHNHAAAWPLPVEGSEEHMRVAIYARVSTANNGQDPTMQTRELRGYCERRGWTVAGEYVDVGVSGTKERSWNWIG